MERVARAFPILEGHEDEVQRFIGQLRERAEEADAFYRRYGARETWHLQQTPHGPWLIGVVDVDTADIADVAARYAGSQQEFEAWFKGRVREFTGIDLDVQPLGPPSELVFDTATLAAAARATGASAAAT